MNVWKAKAFCRKITSSIFTVLWAFPWHAKVTSASKLAALSVSFALWFTGDGAVYAPHCSEYPQPCYRGVAGDNFLQVCLLQMRTHLSFVCMLDMLERTGEMIAALMMRWTRG